MILDPSSLSLRQLFTSFLDDWAHHVDRFFTMLDSETPEDEPSSSTRTLPTYSGPLLLLAAPPTTDDPTPESSATQPPPSAEIIARNRHGAVDTLSLQELKAWTPAIVFDNEVKMLARCVRRASREQIPAVYINFELAAWMFCMLSEVRSNRETPLCVDTNSWYVDQDL